jgi:pilus assembly protein Flp/PilA
MPFGKVGASHSRGELKMSLLLKVLMQLHRDEEGQGLVEYLLILALVAFAATAGMGSLASYLNQAFSAVGSLLNAYIT